MRSLVLNQELVHFFTFDLPAENPLTQIRTILIRTRCVLFEQS